MSLMRFLSRLRAPTPPCSILHPFCSRTVRYYMTSRLPEFDGYLLDMDGVIYYENVFIPEAKRFLNALRARAKPFVFVTNSSASTSDMIAKKIFALSGISVSAESVITSAHVTAQFVSQQSPAAKCFVIGGDGIINDCVSAGLELIIDCAVDAEYVIIGEGGQYDFNRIQFAVNHIHRGARLIGTNSDAFDRSVGGGIIPACGALTAVIERSTGVSAHFCGKPSPLMMTAALRRLAVSADRVCLIGDRIDTDIVGAAQFGITSALVLTGVTKADDIRRFAVRPTYVINDLSSAVIAPTTNR